MGRGSEENVHKKEGWETLQPLSRLAKKFVAREQGNSEANEKPSGETCET